MLYRQMLNLADVICHMRCGRCYNHQGRCYILLLFISGRCYCHMMLWKMLYHITVCNNTLYWQVLLPSGRWNSHYRVVVKYQLVDVITRWQMEWPQGQSYFNLSSEVLRRTSSHMCGRWYLPMFLFRDGLLTLINNASFIKLLRFWSSLPTMLKFSIVTL